MYPLLFSIGPIHVFSLSVFLIVAWLVFSFVFWRLLRNQAVMEERIFDLTFYSTVTAFIFARIGFIIEHKELFSESLIKVIALWIQPGLSLYGGIFGGMLAMLYLSRKYKVRVGYTLDSLAFAIPLALWVGMIGSLLDGTEIGKLTSTWGIHYIGHVGLRHPIQVYELAALLFILLLLTIIQKKAIKESWPFGVVGLWFFFFYSVFMFNIEFFKESSIYWRGLSANQWVLIGLFGETLGAFYVRGGIRESLRPGVRHMWHRMEALGGGIYAKFSRRRSG